MKTIKLDLRKVDGLNKSFTSRVSDKDDKIYIDIAENKQPLSPPSITSAKLKACSPTGKYYFVTGVPNETGFTFKLPSGFNSVKGYFKDAYVEVVKEGKTLSTQSFNYYSYGDADLKESNTGDYISRVEEIIAEINDKVDAMLDNVEPQVDQLKADIQTAQTQLDNILAQSEGALYVHKTTVITNQDWNTITSEGIYTVNVATGENRPVNASTGAISGILEVFKHGDSTVQRYTQASNSKVWVRSSTGSPVTFTAWTYYVLPTDVFLRNETYNRTTIDDKIDGAKVNSASISEINEGTANNVFISPKGFKDYRDANPLSVEVTEWNTLPLESGVIAADGTTPKYRKIIYRFGNKIRTKVEFSGAIKKIKW